MIKYSSKYYKILQILHYWTYNFNAWFCIWISILENSRLSYLSPPKIPLDWISIDAKISNKICLFLCSIILHPAEKLETFFIVCFIPDVTDVSFSFAKNKSRKNRSLTVTHTIQRRVFRLKGWYKSNYNKTQKYKYCHIFGCHNAAKIV